MLRKDYFKVPTIISTRSRFFKNFRKNIKINKAKNILIVTEAFTNGGLETHIRGEIEELKHQGWGVYMMAGYDYNPELLTGSAVDDVVHGVDFNKAMTVPELVDTINIISTYIKKYRIDVVHAHPFMSLVPAYLAAAQCKKKFVITLHGPASVVGFYGPTYDAAIRHIIQHSATIVVSNELKEILKLNNYITNNLYLLPNAIKLTTKKRIPLKSIPAISSSKWAIISRLDEQKVNGLKIFLGHALRVGVKSISVIGDGPQRANFEEWCAMNDYSGKVKFLGLNNDIQTLMLDFDAVAGMGRVVLEAAEAGRIICLVGYDGVKGIISSESTLKSAAEGNFSGRNMKNINFKTLTKQYSSLEIKAVNEVSLYVRKNYDQADTWRVFADIVEECSALHDERAVRLVTRMSADHSQPYLNKPWLETEYMLNISDD